MNKIIMKMKMKMNMNIKMLSRGFARIGAYQAVGRDSTQTAQMLRPQQSACCRFYGEWAAKDVDSGPVTSSGRAGSNVFSGYADEYDVHRPDYPSDMWRAVEDACANAQGISVKRMHNDPSIPKKEFLAPFGHALDVAAGTGRGALELARRGLFHRVTATDLDVGMLAQAEANANAHELSIDTLHAPAEELTGIADGSVDLCVSLQAFHWFDAERALLEFRRVLNPDTGLLLLAWNDRDLTVPWIQQLESAVEDFNPLYHRRLKQTEHVTSYGSIFSPIFTSIESEDAIEEQAIGKGLDSDNEGEALPCLRFENRSSGMTSDSLIAQMRTMSYVRNALDNHQLAAFESQVRQIVDEHHGEHAFDMPWTTKVYLLRPKWGS